MPPRPRPSYQKLKEQLAVQKELTRRQSHEITLLRAELTRLRAERTEENNWIRAMFEGHLSGGVGGRHGGGGAGAGGQGQVLGEGQNPQLAGQDNRNGGQFGQVNDYYNAN